MVQRSLGFTLMCLIALWAIALPAFGISISCSYGEGEGFVSSSERFDLDRSTSMQNGIAIGSGGISQSLQASGTGTNNMAQSVSGSGYSLQDEIDSQGSLKVSRSSFASAQMAILSQGLAGSGSVNFAVQSNQGSAQAGQEASVAGGALASSQSLSVTAGVSAGQSTQMAGTSGCVVAKATGEENVMSAAGSFFGPGALSAEFVSSAAESASVGGAAAVDGVNWLNDGSFRAISSGSLGMGVSGLRDAGMGLGFFEVRVLNLELRGEQQGGAVSPGATSPSGASSGGGGYDSSYSLTGYRLNRKDAQLQLYLNSKNTPSGLTEESVRDAIAAAANAWDDAAAQNIFADGDAVKVDNSLQVDNPFTSTPVSDGYSVNGWWGLGSSYLGIARWWSNGQLSDGYYSITEADIWYNKDKQWTVDWNTAVGNGFVYDLQSVATHELGHSIGMGDIYSTAYGGTLPSSDPRTSDFEQVMNVYDGPQRALGNGDRTGVQKLYGTPLEEGMYLYVSSYPFV
ncbi:MAG: matrixin family metalloprotease [Methanothrix sp.]|nr:matrixin family metalloprotease [Methanothrix sp.]